MATAANFAELLECPVCYETFRDPHFLDCGHTFCRECIDKLVVNNQISCPTCREITLSNGIRKDFNTNKLVENLPRDGASSERKPKACCDICKDIGKDVTSYCNDCEEMMCHECTKAHKGSKLSRDHNVRTVCNYVDDLKSKITQNIQKLNNFRSKVEDAKSMAQQQIKQILNQQAYLHQKVDKEIDILMCTLEKHKTKLKQTISSNDNTVVAQLNSYIENMTELNSNIETQVAVQNELLKSEEVGLLKDVSYDVEVPLLPELHVNDTTKCSVTTHGELEPDRYISVDVTGLSKPSPIVACYRAPFMTVNPFQTPATSVRMGAVAGFSARRSNGTRTCSSMGNAVDYSCLKGKQLQVVKRCRQTAYRMSEVNGNIWVIDDNNNCVVYSKSLDKLATVEHKDMKGPRGLAVTDQSSVIVASRTGLHVINKDYMYNSKINNNSYHDVCYHNNILYAINADSKCIEMYRSVKFLLILTENIDIKHVNFDYMNRIFTTDSGIVVSNNSNVYTHSCSGVLVKHITHTEGTGSGQFYDACLCGVDSNNTYMYCDPLNNRLQLCDKLGRYTTIPMPGGVEWPKDVIVEQHTGVVWLIYGSNYKSGLLKLKIL